MGERKRQLYAAAAETFGNPSNDVERGKRDRAVSLFVQSDVTADELRVLAEKARAQWKVDAVTDMGVAGNIVALRASNGRSNGGPPSRPKGYTGIAGAFADLATNGHAAQLPAGDRS